MAASKPTSWLSERTRLPFPLSMNLGTLVDGLGSSPFDDEA